MRHQVAGYKLGRSKAARIALRRNLIKHFFTHERIRTTRAKAAAIRGHCSWKGLHLAMTGEPRGFSRVTAGFSSYDGEFRLLLVRWPANVVRWSISWIWDSLFNIA